MLTASQLVEQVLETRQRTMDLVADLTDEQLRSPYLSIVNLLIWEIGHVAWFQENWVLRHMGRQKPIRPDGDSLYDSAAVHHKTRWTLPLPSRAETLAYMGKVRDRVVEQLEKSETTAEQAYFVLLSVFHEDMHAEAITYTRQTLSYPAPLGPLVEDPVRAREGGKEKALKERGSLPGDVEVPGGTFLLGAQPGEGFVFDNEKWAHPVEIRPFRIARAPVTQAEFAAFVDAGGYRRREFWSESGWDWRNRADAAHPVYWQKEDNGDWRRRHFDQWIPLEPDLPVVHVNWYEAEAFCAYAKRRLPTEVEWEAAAAAEPDEAGRLSLTPKRRFPWGEQAPSGERANLDWSAMSCMDVAAFPDSDSAWGCRQMIGNIWEWTGSDFLPYPGFEIDPYKEYSQPWFGTHKVLRGGSWATRARLIRNTWRNYYTAERRDIFAGFRTCALDNSQ